MVVLPLTSVLVVLVLWETRVVSVEGVTVVVVTLGGARSWIVIMKSFAKVTHAPVGCSLAVSTPSKELSPRSVTSTVIDVAPRGIA